MTAAVSPSLRRCLEDPRTRRTLAGFVRHRLRSCDADDVVQSTLCAALAADAPPEEPSRILAWLAGIARHKIVDVLRRDAREDKKIDPDAVAVPGAPFEARQLGSRIAAELSLPAQQTLEWLARESEGETWAEIARRENLPASVVRQRASRLRRGLRLRWLGALVVVLGGMAGALAITERQERAAIVADVPPGSPAALAGEWRVTRVALDDGASPALRAAVAAEAVVARVRIDGDHVVVTTPAKTRSFVVTPAAGGDGQEWLLRDEAGRDHRVRVGPGGALRLQWTGDLGGTADLTRR